MIELARHLEVLLLSNDCVTVPDFGGFVAHYVPARIDEADQTFLPPTRTVGFNPQLKMNDSLLVQSYVEANDISYPEALRRIEQEVDNIKKQIMYNGSYQLENIGMLTINDEGSYCFEPNESGLLTPTLYGLSSFDFRPLKSTHITPAPPIEANAELSDEKTTDDSSQQVSLIELVDNSEEEDHAIHIKMSWIRNSIAVAAAIILFFMMTTPVVNSNLGSQTMSSLKTNLFTKIIPKDTNMAPATPILPSEPSATVKEEAKMTAKQDSCVKEAPPAEPVYHIVLASQVKRSNAELFAETMRSKGFKDTDLYIYNNVIRVVYGHFKSEADAYSALHKLREHEEFEEAWVYKRKTEG